MTKIVMLICMILLVSSCGSKEYKKNIDKKENNFIINSKGVDGLGVGGKGSSGSIVIPSTDEGVFIPQAGDKVSSGSYDIVLEDDTL